jgi:thiamine biosynthesis protein ThiI
MDRCVVCHYHEISLKGNNRGFFESRLQQNIEQALTGLSYRSVARLSSRLLVELHPDSPVEEIEPRLRKVFGLVSCSPAWVSGVDLEALKANLWELVREREFQTFRISARRSDKAYPLNSQQLNEALGAFLVEKTGRKVRLEGPDLTCHLELVRRHAYLYFEKLPAVGGLPVGSAGRVAVLLSGGIDSPIAAYKVMKRGCRALFVHFHSFPHTSLESQDKVRQLVNLLNQHQYGSDLYLVPFAEAQRQVVALCPPEVRVILYRRLMLRLAERIAVRSRALALVTGDSIGQVASQTLENLHVIGAVAQLPVLRPLIGEDKEEIIQMARRLGTFEISTGPDVDCCSLFVPRHPETRAKLQNIERVEQSLDLEAIQQDALARTVRERIEYRP